SKIREHINRPVFAFANSDEENLKGSGRSIPGVHLRDLLAFVDASDPGLLGKYGGHAMAAGLTLPQANLRQFERACESAMTRLFPAADFDGQYLSDGELAASSLNLKFAEQLRACGPFGQGFSEPVFDGVFQVLEARVVGETHAKLRLMPKSGDRPLDAIAFGQAECLPLPKGIWVELVYRLDVNEFRGIRSAQLMVEQLRPCD
ncbi:MAG: DHHA1 domain-containing protein, partial [Pseudomonadota bacterium]